MFWAVITVQSGITLIRIGIPGINPASALQNTKAALSGVQAAQAYVHDNALTEAANASNAATNRGADDPKAAKGATNTIGITASYGSQSSKSETRTDSRQSQGSTLTAGQNLSITATGKNNAAQSGDITISGSQVTRGQARLLLIIGRYLMWKTFLSLY
ncbi:hemagglutinin repeat-containing protein [Dryocola sp. BD626]|uniref:hemagglutinin repeat-containing protein n=1 Tax=Dryocola sp. BD626 TaxID=3133273 RepID=UPI003F4F85D4